MREEVVGLEDDAEPPADRHRVDRGVGDHLPVEEDVAVVDLLEQIDAAQQGRLARSRGADQRHRVVLADRQGDAAEDLALAEGLGHLTDLDHRRRHQRRLQARPDPVDNPRQGHGDGQVEDRGGDQRRVVEGRGGVDLGHAECLARDAEDRDQRDVLLQRDEVVEQGWADPADRLRQDHVAQRLRRCQPDRQRCVALAAVDRGDPGPVDLGDVGAVGERQGDPAEDRRDRSAARSAAAPGSRSRSGRRAGSPGSRAGRRCRRSPEAAADRARACGWCGPGRPPARARGRPARPP